MKPYVIGIAGRAGSGKNLFAALLASELLNLGYTVKLDAFATPIKREARKLLGYDGVKSTHMRWALQTMGDVMSGADGFALIHRLVGHAGGEDVLIVCDVRRRQEAGWAANHGRLCLVTGREMALEASVAAHKTEAVEQAVEGLGATVVNNHGDLDALQTQARTVAHDVGEVIKRQAGGGE